MIFKKAYKPEALVWAWRSTLVWVLIRVTSTSGIIPPETSRVVPLMLAVDVWAWALVEHHNPKHDDTSPSTRPNSKASSYLFINASFEISLRGRVNIRVFLRRLSKAPRG